MAVKANMCACVCVCSETDVQFWCEGESSSEDEAAYDEDDENAENNWRNDYPDDDPMYFERLHLDDYFSSGDDASECATQPQFSMFIYLLPSSRLDRVTT